MTDDLLLRRRRAAYRASHRGTKEMDVMIGRYADAILESLDVDGLTQFEKFLALPDPMLSDWLLKPDASVAGEFASLIASVRRFHGLDVIASEPK